MTPEELHERSFVLGQKTIEFMGEESEDSPQVILETLVQLLTSCISTIRNRGIAPGREENFKKLIAMVALEILEAGGIDGTDEIDAQ